MFTADAFVSVQAVVTWYVLLVVSDASLSMVSSVSLSSGGGCTGEAILGAGKVHANASTAIFFTAARGIVAVTAPGSPGVNEHVGNIRLLRLF